MSQSPTSAASVADRANEKSHAGAKVIVACKQPNGHRLRVFKMVSDREPVLGGGFRETQIARFDKEVHVNGTAKRVEEAPACMIIHGYALTQGVDKDIWDRWLADNKESDMVKNRLIFAAEKASDVEAMAKESRDVRSNMEPLNGAEDARAPKAPGMRIEAGSRAAA